MFSLDPRNVFRPYVKTQLFDFTAQDTQQLEMFGSRNRVTRSALIRAMHLIEDLSTNVHATDGQTRSMFAKRGFGDKMYLFARVGTEFAFRLRFRSIDEELTFDSREMRLFAQAEVQSERNVSKGHFRTTIFDYQPIETSIEVALGEGRLSRPSLLYVADLPVLPLGVRYKHQFDVPLVFDAHEWWSEQHRIWGTDRSDAKCNAILTVEKELYPHPDLCITVGALLADKMSEVFERVFKVIHTCNADPTPPKRKQPNFWGGLIQGYKDQKIALFQGSLTHERDLDQLARVTRYLPEEVLLVVAGRGSYEKTFESVLRTEGNANRVVMLGWQPQERLSEITIHADCGVIPYRARSEYFAMGAPNKLFEFLDARLPIVFDGSMSEIERIVLGTGVGIASSILEPRMFAGDLVRLLKDGALRSEIASSYSRTGTAMDFDGQSLRFSELLGEMLPYWNPAPSM